MIRKIIKEKIKLAGIDKIEVEKSNNNYKIFIKVAKPGLVIGRGGKGVDDLRKIIEESLIKLFKSRKTKEDFSVSLNIEELRRNEVSSNFIAQSLAWDLEKRMPFRRTIKKYIESVMQNKEVEGRENQAFRKIGWF